MKKWRAASLGRFLTSVMGVTLASSLWADPVADRQIKEAAYASQNFRTRLAKNVVVDAEDGWVTLRGTVRDRQDRVAAEQTVRHLPGVVGVENRIELATPQRERADGWIALKIRSILLMRSDVSVTNTDVSVTDGVVTLSGQADSPEQKRLTGLYALGVPGVKDVRNELRVRGEDGTESEAGRGSAQGMINTFGRVAGSSDS